MTDNSSMDEAETPKEASPQSARGRTIIILLVIVAFLALGLWLAYRPIPDQLEGMVDAHELRITSKVTGRIASIDVAEGQSVTAGQLLYTVASPEVAAKTEQAGGALAAAEAMSDKARTGARPEDIRAAEAQWKRADAAATLAETTYQRTQRLAAEGVLAGQKRDEARTNAIASREAANAARAQYDLARAGARSEDKAAAGGQVQQARGAAAEVAAAAAETQVTAPMAGEIGRRLAQPGELVPQGFPVFMLTDIRNPWVTINVREDQLHDVSKGRNLTGKIPALDGRRAEFRVTFLAPAGDFATWRATRQSTGFDIKSFEVRVTPTKLVDGLRPGMTVLFDWPQ